RRQAGARLLHGVRPARLAVRRAVRGTVGRSRRRSAGVAAGEHRRRPGRRRRVGEPAALGHPALTEVAVPSAPDRKGRSGALAGLVAGLALVLVPASVWAADAGTPGAPSPAPPAAVPAVVVPLPPVAEPAEPAELAAPAPPARIR